MKASDSKRRPTQADVARLAEVSQAMVSYVLNDKQAITVPKETRQRILDAIKQLGYVPNTAARSLRTRKTCTIAAVIPDITNPFYPAFARGVQEVAERRGYDMILSNTDGITEKERRCIQSLRKGQVDGAIITPFGLTPADLLPLRELEIAVVVVESSRVDAERFGVDSIYIDNAAVARTAVDYLLAHGHRRIGMIAGIEDTPPRRGRVLGYRQAFAQYGVCLDEQLIRGGDFSEHGGYRFARELLELDPLPTAIFAANDLMAIGALAAVHEAGLRVPENIAIIGIDDIAAARLISPPLTTIRQFENHMGKRAAEVLIDRLEGKATEQLYCEEMPYELIVRGSA